MPQKEETCLPPTVVIGIGNSGKTLEFPNDALDDCALFALEFG
jgi:hypothetical protein